MAGVERRGLWRVAGQRLDTRAHIHFLHTPIHAHRHSHTPTHTNLFTEGGWEAEGGERSE